MGQQHPPDESIFDPDVMARLREQAELRSETTRNRVDIPYENLTHDEMHRYSHELQVYQIELEMQNQELRTTQEELSRSRARYVDLYESAPVAYCTLDASGEVLKANLMTATLLGVEQVALPGCPFSKFVVTEDADAFYLFRKRVMNSGTGQSLELRMIGPESESRWSRLDAVRVVSVQGDPVLRVVVTDISERKKLEADRAEVEQYLRQTQKLTWLGRLAGGISHDFNNMLGVILGFTELAIDKANEGVISLDDLNEVRTATLKSAELTRQLQSFARKQPVVPTVLNVESTLLESQRMLQRIIGENLQLVTSIGDTLWPIWMDGSQMDQILVNLVLNSRDAIEGEGLITVSASNVAVDAQFAMAHHFPDPGDYVCIEVKDNGKGMDKVTLNQMFDPFFTTKPVGKGTGLGLSTVYGSIKQNRGGIVVESELGVGTTIRLYLPRSSQAVSQAARQRATAARGGSGEVILLVEDEPGILNVTTIMLQNMGYHVLAASNAVTALERVREHDGQIDLLITDVVMPGKNGRDLAADLRRLQSGLKCLYMSGYTDDVIAGDGFVEEGLNFLQKPFTMKMLAEKVKETLSRAS